MYSSIKSFSRVFLPIVEHPYWLRSSNTENKMAEGTVTLTEAQFERFLMLML